MNISSSGKFLNIIRLAAKKRLLFLPHAVRQMARPDRMISTGEVKQTVIKGEMVEDYPDDNRGHSCLLMGRGVKERPIHVVCSPKEDYLAIITAYLPSEQEWKNNFKERKK
jgi:hypothetical protein